MKPTAVFQEFEQIAEELGIRIMLEKGNFYGGYCLLEEKRIIVVNTQSGTNLQSKPLLWPGEIVKMTGNYYIVQSENNLFVVPM